MISHHHNNHSGAMRKMHHINSREGRMRTITGMEFFLSNADMQAN